MIIKCQHVPKFPLLPCSCQSSLPPWNHYPFSAFDQFCQVWGYKQKHLLVLCTYSFHSALRNSSVLFWLTAFHSFLQILPKCLSVILDITLELVGCTSNALRTVLYCLFLCMWVQCCGGLLFPNDSVDSAHERPRHSRAWLNTWSCHSIHHRNLTHVIMQRHLFNQIFIVFSRLIIKLVAQFSHYFGPWDITSFTKDTFTCHAHVFKLVLFLVDLQANY